MDICVSIIEYLDDGIAHKVKGRHARVGTSAKQISDVGISFYLPITIFLALNF